MVVFNINNIFVLGGRNANYFDLVRKYDFEKDTWVTMSSMK